MSDKKPIKSIGLEAQQIIYRISKMEVGEILTYEELEAMTKRPIEELRSSWYTAARNLYRERGWVFGCIYKVGYKRLDDLEKIDSAESRRKHIHNTARKMGSVLSSIEHGDLQGEQLMRYHRELAFAGALSLATGRKARLALEQKITASGIGSALPAREVLLLFGK
jgi:hypothetical protein